MGNNKKGRNGGDRATQDNAAERNPKPPIVGGQCAQVLGLIRQFGPVPSLEISVGHAIPETAARVHDLRARGFNVITEILPEVEFRGETRRNVALYSIGFPEWPAPGFLKAEGGGDA